MKDGFGGCVYVQGAWGRKWRVENSTFLNTDKSPAYA